MKQTRFILASASPRRRELLRQVGIFPRILPSQVEEIITSVEPDQVVKELSAQKAEDVAARCGFPAENRKGSFDEDSAEAGVCPIPVPGERKESPDKAPAAETGGDGTAGKRILIGADTVVAVDGTILGKPVSEADAVRMIGLIQGRDHQVYTGVTLILEETGERATFAVRTDVHVYPMSREEIRRYVATGEPMDKAGAYGIQGAFAAYIRGIDGDYSNVVGLPVGRLCRELGLRGIRWWEG